MLSLGFLLVSALTRFFVIYNRIVQGVLRLSAAGIGSSLSLPPWLGGICSPLGGLCFCVLNIYSCIWCKQV